MLFDEAENAFQADLEDADLPREPGDPIAIKRELRAAKALRISDALIRIKRNSQNTYNPTAGACYGNGRKDQFKKLRG